MIRSTKLFALVAACCLRSPSRASCDVLRWTFGLQTPEGLVDAREEVALSDACGDWKQVFGREADPLAPDLYPRTPDARLVARSGGGERLLCLRTLGGRALLVAGPRPIPELPRFGLHGAADTSRLGRGSLVAAVRFLGSDAVTALGESSCAFARSGLLEIKGLAPRGAAFAALSLRLAGSANDPEERALIEFLELELLPGLRVVADRSVPLYDAREDVVLRVEAHGLARGPYKLRWKLARVTLPDDAPGPACEVGESLAEEELSSWAPARRPAIWTLKVSSPRASGSYKLSLRASSAGLERILAEDVLFGVVARAPESPRSSWKKIEDLLASSTAPCQYAGAFLIPASNSGSESFVHVFEPRAGDSAAVFIADSPGAGEWLRRAGYIAEPRSPHHFFYGQPGADGSR